LIQAFEDSVVECCIAADVVAVVAVAAVVVVPSGSDGGTSVGFPLQ
jgi:hypothetical protein